MTVLLNYKTPEMTVKSLRAAMAAMEDLAGEIVVVDNASGDGSYESIRQVADQEGWLTNGRVRLIQSPVNGGFGTGMNLGMQAGLSDGCRPDFYYLLNSDAFANEDTIRTLRDFLQETPEAGFAGSYVHGLDDDPHCTAFRFPTLASEFEGAAHTGLITRLLPNVSVPMDLPIRATRVDWTAGASLMIRADVIQEVGGFDETFFLYFEETELCNRAAAAGWHTYYVPESRIAHVGSASTGMKRWSRTPGYWFDSRWHYFSKVHGRFYAVAATFALLAGSGIYCLRRLIQTKPQMNSDGFIRDLWTHMRTQLARPTKHLETRPLSSEPKEPK
nr:glycosyltransferase family 2 protein [Epibacterium ulvae]